MSAENTPGIDAFFATNSFIEQGFVPPGMHPLEFQPYTDIWDTLQFPNYPDMPSYRLGLLHHVILAVVNFGQLIENGGNLLDYIRRIDISLRGYDPNQGQINWASFTAVPGLSKFIWDNIAISASCCVSFPGFPPVDFPHIIKHCFNFDLFELIEEKDKKDRVLKFRRNAVVLTLGGLVACWFVNNPEAYAYAFDATREYHNALRFSRLDDGTLSHKVSLVKNYRTYAGEQNYSLVRWERTRSSGDQRGYYARQVPRHRSGSGYWDSLRSANLIDY